MMEKFPKMSERKEGAERPPRYRTIESEIVEPLKDGTETVRVIECNGVLHRRCVDKISYKMTKVRLSSLINYLGRNWDRATNSILDT